MIPLPTYETPVTAVAEIIRSAAPFCEIRVIGEFHEPEWVVLPPGRETGSKPD